MGSVSSNVMQAITIKAQARRQRPSTACRLVRTPAAETTAPTVMLSRVTAITTHAQMALALNPHVVLVRCSAMKVVHRSMTRRPAAPATSLAAAAMSSHAQTAAVFARITTRRIAARMPTPIALPSRRHPTVAIAATSAAAARHAPMAIASARMARQTAARMRRPRVTACHRIPRIADRVRHRVMQSSR